MTPQSENPKTIAILGAGISGLTAAYRLKGQEVTVFEKESRVGGLIRTSFHNGSLFEWGPRSIRKADADATLKLIKELGLSDEIIYASSDSKTRYILKNGKLEKMRFLPYTGALFRNFFSAKSIHEDESIYDYFCRRFSAEFADHFIDPMVKGIFAGDPKQLSMRSCFPKMWEGRSFFFQKRGLFTLKNGLESLTQALANQVRVCLNTCIHKISFERDKIQLHHQQGIQEFDRLISTLPAYALSLLLPTSSLKEHLLKLPFVSVGVMHLGYLNKVHPYRGFGYLVPSSEQEEILGVVFDSETFLEQNVSPIKTRMTVMMKDHANPESALKAVERHLNIQEKPTLIQSKLIEQAIPQYPVGFHRWLASIQEASREFSGLTLLGTSFYGVSVNRMISLV